MELKIITQMTPIPTSIVAALKADTPDDYQFKESGFAMTVGQIMANNLQVYHSEWHAAYTSIKRSDMILSAAKSLAFLYKNASSPEV